MTRALTLAVLLSACRVTFPDDAPYSCTSDADCGGGDAKCVGNPQFCCTATGAEVCGDNRDNDCDGTVDAAGTVEICNGMDDNCDGRSDEGFNLTLDPKNCGTCGHTCAPSEVCTDRMCTTRRETLCSDGLDDDFNGKTDCLDPQCEGRFCGDGCACRALVKSEASCNDARDNDDDMDVDCADADCVGKSCGLGCTCVAGGGKKETRCNDAASTSADNDGDGLIDCADPDCLNEVCTPSPLFFTCTAGGLCKCNGGAQIAEVGMLCRDNVDNDCDGTRDCAEMSCDGQTCAGDAGMGMCSTLMCMP